jgi:mannosyltransferase
MAIESLAGAPKGPLTNMPPRDRKPSTPAALPDANAPDRLLGRAMTGIFLLATALRLYNLGGPSLWFDEVLTVGLSSTSVENIPTVVRNSEQTPPLLHFIMHAWTGQFGLHEFWVRFPAAAFGALAVGVTYLLGAALFGRREGCVAALLMALSNFQIAYSQEARVYSLLLLMSTLSCLAFVKVVREGGLWNQIGYVFATGVLYWTHLHSVFVVAAQQVAWLYLCLAPPAAEDERPRISTPRWILLTVLAVSLFTPWMPTVVHWLRAVSKDFWIPPMGPAFLFQTYAAYAGSAILLVLLIVLAALAVARTPDRWKLVLLISLAILPVTVPYIVSLLVRPLFVPRYAIAASVGMFLLAGRGLTTLPNRPAQLATLVALVALSVLGILQPNAGERKPDARGAAFFVADRVHKGDVVLFDTGLANATLYHYLHDQGMDRFKLIQNPAELAPPAHYPPNTELWSIAPGHPATDQPPKPRVSSPPLNLGWRLAETYPFDGLIVERYAQPE